MSDTTPINAASFLALEQPPRLLLGPGPSSVHPRVYAAMTQPMVGHLDPTFIDVMDQVQDLLRYLFQTENELTIPISGTGSAAMETCIANLVEPGDKVLVCVNGYFGLRLAEMATRYGGDVATVSKPWGQVLSAATVDAALEEHPAKIVAIVHGETSTGAMQPIGEIAEVVHNHNALLIVDTVASLGGAPFHVDALGVDACYTGSQKCLSAPPGSGPVTFGPRAVEKIEARKTPVTSWYLDVTLLRKYWGTPRMYHHTAPISATYALYEALRLVAEEGLEAVWARHQQAAEALYAGLKPLGLQPHIPAERRLPTLTTVRLPEDDGFDEAGIRRALLEQHNIEIAGGLGDFKGKVWRVGLMGHSARLANVEKLLAALGELLS